MGQAVKVGGERGLEATSQARDPSLSFYIRLADPGNGHYVDASAGASASSPSSGHQLGFWRSLDWKLMLALLFPTMLETLDYTGMSVVLARRSLR